MSATTVPDTGVPLWPSRYFSPAEVAAGAKALIGSGVVDDVYLFDQLTSWWPRSLWTPRNAPIAGRVPDFDSFPDITALGGYLAGQVPDAGIVFSHDTLRRGPAELAQTMLTMADLTGGRATYALGAGEVKQARPFGHKRSEGLARLEDALRVFNALWESDGLIDYQGNIWTLRNAWLGASKANRPKVWIMGGGPRIIDLATSYCDGFVTAVPWVFLSPEDAAVKIRAMKEQLERKGRDPEAFGFGAFVMAAMHDDPDAIERGFENPLIKWMTAVFGRLAMSDWVRDGFEPPFPLDWHYAMKLMPMEIGQEEADRALAAITPEMSRSSWLMGGADQLARQVQPYIEAGLTWVCPCDCFGLTLPEEEWPAAMQRTLDFCRIIKGASAGSQPLHAGSLAVRT